MYFFLQNGKIQILFSPKIGKGRQTFSPKIGKSRHIFSQQFQKVDAFFSLKWGKSRYIFFLENLKNPAYVFLCKNLKYPLSVPKSEKITQFFSFDSKLTLNTHLFQKLKKSHIFPQKRKPKQVFSRISYKFLDFELIILLHL